MPRLADELISVLPENMRSLVQASENSQLDSTDFSVIDEVVRSISATVDGGYAAASETAQRAEVIRLDANIHTSVSGIAVEKSPLVNRAAIARSIGSTAAMGPLKGWDQRKDHACPTGTGSTTGLTGGAERTHRTPRPGGAR